MSLTLTILGCVYLILMPWSVRHYAQKKAALDQGVKDPDDLEHED